MQMRGHLQRQLLLGTGRTNHELIQSTDCILRQLTLGAEHASNQPLQIEGRFHRELLQTAGNAQFQLLMASSPPAIKQHDVDNDRQRPLLQHGDQHDGSRDVSPPDDADNGHQGTLSQPEDRDLHGAKRRGQEEKVVTQ